MDNDLSTIAEEEDTDVSVSTAKSSNNAERPLVESRSIGGTSSVGDNDKKKKKKARGKDSGRSELDYDTAHQILIDLCTEMKDLKKSMQEGQKKASENLESNQQVVTRLADQMEMLRGNMKQLDQTIESKATPKQIEDMGRIRAVQEIVKAITDDKERTVGVYEAHARRGYEEIERLRRDLNIEREEVAALRAELKLLRGDRQRMLTSGTNPENGLSPVNMFVNADDSVGGNSEKKSYIVRPGALYNHGQINSGMLQSSVRGDFDDMTLMTKESYETSAYEMKSLKKRIIHMKKKLTAAQLEAKETEELREEVERLRVQAETEKKASLAKDEIIKSLEDQMFYDTVCPSQPAAKTLTTDITERSNFAKPQAVKSKPLPAKANTAKKKWWDI
ncbi:hypothetical protein ACHAXA_010765 [Cyclostephanos tholiformis]|uniref:Uncharacterized protein n=1 Tax=Cyclostephanos tholiformis TaxID=382380 RepID=A0ABD3R549_9STRA